MTTFFFFTFACSHDTLDQIDHRCLTTSSRLLTHFSPFPLLYSLLFTFSNVLTHNCIEWWYSIKISYLASTFTNMRSKPRVTKLSQETSLWGRYKYTNIPQTSLLSHEGSRIVMCLTNILLEGSYLRFLGKLSEGLAQTPMPYIIFLTKDNWDV